MSADWTHSSWNEPDPNARRCAVVMPVMKSIGVRGGGFIATGLASSERRDLQGQILRPSRSPGDLLGYLERCGVVDWEHTKPVIGKARKARVWDAVQIAKALPGQDIVGPAIWMENAIHALPVDLRLATPGHIECHRLHEADHPLFMSAYGRGVAIGKGINAAGETGEIVVPLVLSRVAMTPEPMNMDAMPTTAVIAKSLSEFTRELEEGDHTQRNGVERTQAELPPLVYFAREIYDTELARSIAKSLEATSTIPVEGTTGFDAAKTSDIPNGHGRKCRGCEKDMHSDHRFCPHCGREAGENISKSLSAIVAHFAKPHAMIG